MWFEVILGLKINLEKSELILVGNVPIVEELVLEIGCRKRELPAMYLGVRLGPHFKLWVGWHTVR